MKSQPRNREEEDLIATLYAQTNKLKLENKSLDEKNKELEIKVEKKSKEITVLKRDILRIKSHTKNNVTVSTREKPVPPPPLPEITLVPSKTHRDQSQSIPSTKPSEPQHTDANLLEIAKQLKSRLVTTL